MKKKTKRVPTGDYPVGFARPPKEHHFPKGKSGNLKGRPRKPPEAPLIAPDQLVALLNQPIVAQKNGLTQKLSLIEARALAMVRKALVQRSVRAIKYILSRAIKYGLIELPEKTQTGGVVTIPHRQGVPYVMEKMLALRFGIPADGQWLPEEIEAIRPHYESYQQQEEERMRQRYREEFRNHGKQ